MAKVKLYDLKTDEVVMKVEPVDVAEILASKDCGVSDLTADERKSAKKDDKKKNKYDKK